MAKLTHKDDDGRLVADQRLLVVRARGGDTTSWVQVAAGDRVPERYEDAEKVAYADVYGG